MDDFEPLLHRIRTGERRAYEELGKRMNGMLRTFFSDRFGAELANELTQRTLLDLLEKLPQVALDGPTLTNMIYGFAWIEIRKWVGGCKQEGKRAVWRAEHIELLAPRRGLDELFAEVELWLITEAILDELPATHRDVLIARLRGYSYKTIAVAFDIKAVTARARVRVAKQHIMRRRERGRLTKTTFRTTKNAS